jgi:hypothetical protein
MKTTNGLFEQMGEIFRPVAAKAKQSKYLIGGVIYKMDEEEEEDNFNPNEDLDKDFK